jgi:hypothetical protein
VQNGLFVSAYSQTLLIKCLIFNFTSVCAAMSQSLCLHSLFPTEQFTQWHWLYTVALPFVQPQIYWYCSNVADILRFCNRICNVKLNCFSQNFDSNTIGYSKVFIAHNKAVRKAYPSAVLLNLSTFLYLPTSSRRPTAAVNSRIWRVFILRPVGSVEW